MAYAVNDIIEAQHYNTFVWGSTSGGTMVTSNNNINYLWGPGFGNKGMNQDMASILGLPNNLGIQTGVYNDTIGTLTPVDGVSAGDPEAAASTVTSQQWIGLISAMNRALFHQNQANVVLSQAPGFGRDIRFITSMTTYLSTISNNMGLARNRTAIVASGTANKTTSWSAPGSSTNQTLTITRSVEWNEADDARWFFNAGGRIRIGLSAANASNDRSTAIAIVIADLGTSDIGYNSSTAFPGNDSGSSVSRGYWNVSTSSFEQIGKNTALSGSVYADTSVTVSARLQGDAGSNGGRGKRLEFRIDLFSGFGGSGPESAWGLADNINLTITTTLDVFDPAYSGGMLQRTWATPTLD